VPYDERDENNRFQPSFEDAEILAFVESAEMPTTGDVAREFDVTQQAAYYRLDKLRDRGVVDAQKIGNANVWSVVDDA